MEKEQELEWIEAQKIVISEDLVDVAKKQLKFLATVDRYRCLYDGPVLNRAIFRYKTYWLPLLAKHTKSELSESPLVVPLDCEWIWHCHRLNPLRYKADCEEFYGQILDNKNVVSIVQGASTVQTEGIWKELYPKEPYELDLGNSSLVDVSENLLGASKDIQYDFISAVKRQSPFFYQVSKPVMNDDVFLQEAVARYKGFLYMIKRNKEQSIRRFSVPTYDVDLMWHSHQLHPVSYCTDLIEALGKVLEHDDTDSDRGKGQKLDVGFSGTTMQWEETFGTRYWRAGGMYRGVAPSPISVIPQVSDLESKTAVSPTKSQKIIHLSNNSIVEVLLEIVAVRNLPDGHKGNLFVCFSKNNPDTFFGQKKRLSILSESKGKQVASFQCEPSGELVFELMSYSPSKLPIPRPAKTIGTSTVPLDNILDPKSKLSVEKWVELVPSGSILRSDPISLRIAVSITPPTPAPYVLHMVRTRPTTANTCFFSLPGVAQNAKGWTRVVDGSDNEVINIQMRDLKKSVLKNNDQVKREVIGVAGSGETQVLAEFLETGWSLMNSNLSSRLQKKPSGEGHIFELRGSHVVQLFPGRKLEYEPKNFQKQKNEGDFITAVVFSKENPYGKAVALLNVKSGFLKVEEEWFVIPGITLAVILFDILRKEGNNVFTSKEKSSKKNGVVADVFDAEEKPGVEKEVVMSEKSNVVVDEKDSNLVKKDASSGCGGGCGGSGCGNMANAGAMKSMVKSGGCGGGGGCGSGCGNMVSNSAGCGSGCGSGCGNMLSNGAGCGSGCGSGCGNMVTNSAGCGSGCGSGCGNMLSNSAGCGSGCGSGCGNMVSNSAGCGSGCGSGCGNMVSSSGCGGGGGCGSGCGDMLKSSGGGGCGGGGCGGGCGNGIAASA